MTSSSFNGGVSPSPGTRDSSIPRIAIVGGTGRLGCGLALRFAHAGVPVTVGSRVLDRAKDTAATLCEPHSGLTIGFADNGSAIAQADVVVLSVPFPHAAATVIEHRSRFAEGALLIDVTVPVTFESGRVRVIDVVEGSASEHVRACLPASVSVAGAFKTVPAALLREVQQPLDCDDLVCGDSAATRQRAMAIIQRIHGLRPIDAGPLEAARIIEGMTLLAIKLNRRYKTRDARFRVVGI